MPVRDELLAAGINPDRRDLVLAGIARLPVNPSRRAQLLREYELETKLPYLPAEFAAVVSGKVPS